MLHTHTCMCVRIHTRAHGLFKKKGKEGELERERKPTVPTVPGVTTITSFLLAGESTGWRKEFFMP